MGVSGAEFGSAVPSVGGSGTSVAVGGDRGRDVGSPVFPFSPRQETVADAVERLQSGAHLCLVYDSEEEQFAAVVPYLRAGLANGERVLYIVDSSTSEDVAARLRAGGVDVDAALDAGSLVILDKRDTYLEGGEFDPDRMIGVLADATEEALADGYRGLRVTGEMTWMLGGEPGTDRVMEYEAKLNRFFPGSRAQAICQYARPRFDPGIVRGVIQTHPLVVFGGTVCDNDHYVPPEEFLEPDAEVRSRRENERLLRALVERTRLHDRLRTTEARYGLLVESALEGIWVIDADGATVYANPAMGRMLGYDVDEMLGRHLFDFMDASAQDTAKTKLADRRAGLAEQHEFRFRHRDGRDVWTLVSTHPVTDNAGRYEGAAAMLTDITDRRRAEAELRELSADLERRVAVRTAELAGANEELEAFTYSVSHDLRTPIRAIAGFSSILLEEHADQLDEEGQRLLGVVIDSTDRMGQLIDDLLALSRVGRAELRRVQVDVDAMVAEVLEELEMTEPARDLRVDAGPLGTVLADPVLLRQVWTNLLGNARKFTRSRESAAIAITRTDGSHEVRYAISDNGVGLDMRYADKLFNVFQRLHSEAEFEGTGVGLAVVARIIERHGGHVGARGEPDRGATFWFTLPTKER